MGRRATGLMLVAVVAASPACASDQNPPAAARQFDLGAHRLQVTVPTGWDALDQGRQKRFRKGEFDIVLQHLGSPPPSDRGLDALVEWALAAVGHNERREVKSRREATIDGREAVDLETWNRLDHSNPGRILLIRAEDDVLALHTVRLAVAESLAAFDAIRGSLHFVSDRR